MTVLFSVVVLVPQSCWQVEGHVRVISCDGRDEQRLAPHELRIDAVRMGFVWELEEQWPDDRRAVVVRLVEECVQVGHQRVAHLQCFPHHGLRGLAEHRRVLVDCPDVVVGSAERVEGTQLHPPDAQVLCDVSDEAAYVSAYLQHDRFGSAALPPSTQRLRALLPRFRNARYGGH